MKINENVINVGVNDRDITLFEGQYRVEKGMAYNSYLILDEKTAVLDGVDGKFTGEWLKNIERASCGRTIDYLVVQHMEPDHSASVKAFLEKYPETKVVSNSKSFVMMKNFFGVDYSGRGIPVGDNDTLPLGKRTLTFVTAPMVHWPEVIMTYDAFDKILFSADGFGKFGTTDADEDWACEARRYYFGIVGRFGANVQNVLKKAAALDIKTICPLHGVVLNENLGYYLDLYDKWSSYTPEKKGVAIVYSSVYGHTAEAARLLAQKLQRAGVEVSVSDLTTGDMAEAVESAFEYDRLVLATTTYNGGIFPVMRTFIEHLAERNFRGRKVALIENGSWAPVAAKIMKEYMSAMKDIDFYDGQIKILSAVTEENKKEIDTLAAEIAEN